MPTEEGQGHCPTMLPQSNLGTGTIDALKVSEQEIKTCSLNEVYSHSSDKQVSTKEGPSGNEHNEGKNSMIAERSAQDQYSLTEGSGGHSNSDIKQFDSATVESNVPHGFEPEVVTVHQLRSASQFTMAIGVGDRKVNAVVDSAAEVTILSDKVYQALTHKPPKLREVTLLTAGRKMVMKGFVAGPVRLKIGDQWYNETVYIAPIEQEMLVGFDILVHRGKSVLNMAKGTLTFDDQEITLNVGSQGQAPSVARVTVAKRQVIPPNSVMRVKCALDNALPDYVIEPVDNLKVMSPRVVRKAV